MRTRQAGALPLCYISADLGLFLPSLAQAKAQCLPFSGKDRPKITASA